MRSPLHSCVRARARARGSLARVSVSCVPAGKRRAVTCGAMAAAALPRRSPREVTSSGHWRKRAAAGRGDSRGSSRRGWTAGRRRRCARRAAASLASARGGGWSGGGASGGGRKERGGRRGREPPPSGSISATSRLQVEAPHLGLEESDADVARVDAHAGCGSTYRGEDVSWSRRREAGPALSDGRGAPKWTICSGSPPMPSTCSLSPCASVTYSRPLPIAMPIGVCRTGGDA